MPRASLHDNIWKAVILLNETAQPMSKKDLRAALDCKNQMVTMVLEWLTKDGFVRRLDGGYILTANGVLFYNKRLEQCCPNIS